MRIINSAKLLRSSIKDFRKKNKSIGFVPTMGALHKGHLSLIRKSRRENDITVVSIFVNPKQFGPKEDFKSYPRPEKNDILLAKKEKVDIIFRPSEKEMYPTSFLTSINVDRITRHLCGKTRPGHFKGVTTVVGKLLNIVTPDNLYVGQKDAQQAVALKRMVDDLNMNVKVKVAPIVREPDGLALSSRNQYLSATHRSQAPILYQSLRMARRQILNGRRNVKQITDLIKKNIRQNSSGSIEYVECVNADTLERAKRIQGRILLALAVRFGKTRLIDNIIVNAK